MHMTRGFSAVRWFQPHFLIVEEMSEFTIAPLHLQLSLWLHFIFTECQKGSLTSLIRLNSTKGGQK